MSLGKRIAEARKQKNLSQKDLAEILFVSNNTISSWETDRAEPSLELLVKLSEILCCSISVLIHGRSWNLTDKQRILGRGIKEEKKVQITYDSLENGEIERIIQPRALFLGKRQMVLCSIL